MPEQRWLVEVDEVAHEVVVESLGEAAVIVRVDGHRLEVVPDAAGAELVRAEGHQLAVFVADGARPTAAALAGIASRLRIETPAEAARRARREAGASTAGGSVRSPMPGRVVRVLVELGARVERGDPVVIVEAMKMENELFAPSAGIVSAIAVAPGAAVDGGQLLVELGPAGD